jgi:CarD family transcriptional regulator
LYKVNDIIVYSNGGVCVIRDIGIPDFVESKETYYQMQSLSDTNNGTIYVKVNHDDTKLRAIITEDEANELLANIPIMEPLYSPNDKVRDREYNEIIKSCQCERALCMMKGIFKERLLKIASGKKLCMNDDRNLLRISKLLNIEFATALKISIEQAEAKLEKALMM